MQNIIDKYYYRVLEDDALDKLAMIMLMGKIIAKNKRNILIINQWFSCMYLCGYGKNANKKIENKYVIEKIIKQFIIYKIFVNFEKNSWI